ncbi:hypothetical protein [Rhodococcus koreensis]|uniref:hypothetical protein n=1 Tax=Rhodococcus koreensis TaxID=99653 RepID=UPI0036DBB0BE
MSLPAGLHDIEPIDTKMDVGGRGRLDRRHQARQAYAFVPHGARRPDVPRSYRGPAVHPSRVGRRRITAGSVSRVCCADLKKNRLGVHRGFQGFGIRRYTLLAGFTLVALNILSLHDWATRREVLDSWGRFLGEPEPERRPRRRRRSTPSATRHAASLAATGPGRYLPCPGNGIHGSRLPTLSVEIDRLSGTGSPDSPHHSVERLAHLPKKRASQRRMRRK